MRAVPRTFYDDELRVIPSDAEWLVIECEVDHPPSRKGQTVYVVFDVEQVPKLLKEARHKAIQVRSKPMSAGLDRP